MSETHEEKEMKDVEETPQEQPAAEEPKSHEPAEQEPAKASSNEPAGESSGAGVPDVATQPIGATLFTVFAFIALAFVVIGTPIAWMYRRSIPTSVYTTLWYTEVDNAGVITTTYVKDDTCKSRRDHFKAAEAFSIITIAFAFFAVIMGFVARATGNGLKIGGVFGILSFVSNLVCWPIGYRLYYYELCGAKSLGDQQFEIGPGAALFVAAWVLTFVAIVIAFVDPKIPAVLPDVLLDKVGAALFTVGAFASLALTVIATPIKFTYRYDATSETRATLWHWYSDASGIETKSAWKDVSCGDITKYAKFGEAFAIIAIFASLVALIVGALASSGKVGRKVLIPVGLFTFLASLLVVGAEASIFYQSFCAAVAPLDEQKYEFGAGFALFVCAFVVMLVVTLVQIVLALSQLSGASEGNTKWSAKLFLAGSLIALVFTVIAANQYVYVKKSGDNYIRVSWWHVDARISGVYSRNGFSCKKQKEYLNGGGALDIISLLLIAVAVLLGVAQLTSAKLRVAASGVNLLASVTMLVSWALGVAAFHKDDFCGSTNSAADNDFRLATGAGLVIAAWCLTLVISIINLAVSP